MVSGQMCSTVSGLERTPTICTWVLYDKLSSRILLFCFLFVPQTGGGMIFPMALKRQDGHSRKVEAAADTPCRGEEGENSTLLRGV